MCEWKRCIRRTHSGSHKNNNFDDWMVAGERHAWCTYNSASQAHRTGERNINWRYDDQTTVFRAVHAVFLGYALAHKSKWPKTIVPLLFIYSPSIGWRVFWLFIFCFHDDSWMQSLCRQLNWHVSCHWKINVRRGKIKNCSPWSSSRTRCTLRWLSSAHSNAMTNFLLMSVLRTYDVRFTVFNFHRMEKECK